MSIDSASNVLMSQTLTEVCETTHRSGDLDVLKPRLVGERAAGALAATFAVLGDPTRVRLLDALAERELCVCDLATLVGITESAVSHQLRLLRTLRLVRSRRAGRMVFYALDDHHIRTLLQQGRTHIEEATRTAGATSDERSMRTGQRPAANDQ
jgi:ArsR family transcriptional regulator, lead/cadmium/zinc/bismuth-responsive transcriptional repressor